MVVEKMTEFRRSELLKALEKRFGLREKTFQNLDFFYSEQGKVFAVSKAASQFVGRLERVAVVGLPFARIDATAKPSSAMLQVFGGLAERNVLDLPEVEGRKFAAGEGLDLKGEQLSGLENGYVVVKCLGTVLGCGLLKEKSLKNTIPKAKWSKVSKF